MSTDTQPTVWVPCLPTRFDEATGGRVPSMDINAAADFGQLNVLTESPIDSEGEDLTLIYNTISEQCTHDDYILCVGDSLANAVAMMAQRECFGGIRVLRWVRRERQYQVVDIALGEAA